MTASINTALTLESGLTFPNRLVKAAMTEGLADPRNRVTEAHLTLYRRWAEGGIGGMITGNVQIDRNHLERAGNVVIDGTPSNEEMDMFSRWADAGKSHGAAMIMQVSHAGRQTPKLVNPRPAAPSPVALGLPGGQFGQPRAMTREEIRAVVEGFGTAASVAKQAGFDGVQVHAAHGYLLSSFLSPLANLREDDYGGPLENRARLLVECVDAARVAAGPGFSVSVKLNSADFQKGGFSFEDCLAVIDSLNELGVDFVEISGGNYEQPRMMDMDGLEPVFEQGVRESTRKREAYFLKYAKAVQERSRLPLMVTGGFRTVEAMNSALAEGEADLIGLGRPLCVEIDTPKRLLSGELAAAEQWEKKLRLGPGLLGPNSPLKLVKALNGFGAQAWYYEQLRHLGAGEAPDRKLGVFSAFLANQKNESRTEKARKAAMP
ncbi:MAG: NADH:flavin oxidoreductase/NADH oxidase family protein [Hyphomonas sp.]|jgi:2,4-dienoyl-CoA reductase-like NADH-dependent reductase (Old Yellow Enzyme family)|uniref:NADH:flavin oxidoreductase/NADH oxidase family protein n=1 Tax=Hyphomonas sp. TaxID=87 RepID=UPI0032675B1B